MPEHCLCIGPFQWGVQSAWLQTRETTVRYVRRQFATEAISDAAVLRCRYDTAHVPQADESQSTLPPRSSQRDSDEQSMCLSTLTSVSMNGSILSTYLNTSDGMVGAPLPKYYLEGLVDLPFGLSLIERLKAKRFLYDGLKLA